MSEPLRRRHAHILTPEPNGHYPEPPRCSRRLFEDERFEGHVHEPCCGIGNIIASAQAAGFSTSASDIIDYGFAGTRVRDLLEDDRRYDNIVANPPYQLIEVFGPKAARPARRKAALFFPIARLNAAYWIDTLPWARVLRVSPRPSIPSGSYLRETPRMGRLHRDGGTP